MVAYDHLDEADRVSLTLSSRRLHLSLGSNTYRNLSSHYKLEFLSRLARDLPNTYVCFYCEKLHPSMGIRLPGIGPPTPLRPLITCPEQNPELETELLKPVDQVNRLYFDKMMAYKLRFCHVALAMQRYHLGPSHGIPVEWLSSTTVYRRNHDNILRLLSVEAQIAPVSPTGNDASLIIQIQAWAMHVGSGIGAGAGVAQPANTRPPKLKQKICSHVKLNPAVTSLTEDLPGKLAWYSMTCADCGIEPHVYTRDYGEGCKALVVTRWLDLGSGLDIRDYLWNGAVQGNFHRW